VLCCRTLNDRVCDEIQSIRTFFPSPSPPSALSRPVRLLRALSKRLARVRVRIDKKPMGRIKKKKSIIISKHSQSG